MLKEIPARVERYCDLCRSDCTANRNSFKVDVWRMVYDVMGDAQGIYKLEFDLCDDCAGRFRSWWQTTRKSLNGPDYPDP